MDIKTQVSTISELRVAEEFIRCGHVVFTQLNGKAPFDLVVHIEGKLYRVSVKSILKPNKYGVYPIQLRRIRANKKLNKIYLFDKNECDILSVFLHDINKILFFNTSILTQKNQLNVKLSEISQFTIEKFMEGIWLDQGHVLKTCESVTNPACEFESHTLFQKNRIN
jgi:hypothetical protein